MLLLGIDEGTTGVKAALFDEQLRPVAEARRDKVNRHPQAGWVEQDGEEVLAVVVDAVAELLAGATERGGGLRTRPPGRVGARLGRRDRQAAQPDRRLAGQALSAGAGSPRRP